MKGAAILREAWRNVCTGTARVGTFAVLWSLVSVGLTLVELVVVGQLTAEAQRFHNSGASVLTLKAEGRVDAAACQSLAKLPGVRAAGAVREVTPGLLAASLPSSPIPIFEVTPGLPAVLGAPTKTPAGVVLSQEVADTLAVGVGDSIALPSGTTEVAGSYRYPQDGRRSGYGYAVLAPVPATGIFDECWVDAWPLPAQLPELLLSSLLPGGTEQQPQLSQLNSTLGSQFDGNARFNQRITWAAAPLALLLSGGLGWLFVRTRRLQHASALHAGVSRRALVAGTALELLAATLPAALLSCAVIGIAVAVNPSAAVVLLGARVGVLSFAGALLGAAVALAGIRERHLFAYFKKMSGAAM